MRSIAVLILIILFDINFSINCIIGTNINNGICNNNNISESCISGYLDSETKIFLCDNNCSKYNNILKNLTCCSTSDNCSQIITTINNTNSCSLINSSNLCINRTDCYWCNNIMNTGYGSCRSLIGIPSCYIVPLFNPPPICGSILCPPIPDSLKYNVTNPILTKEYLTNFGLPPLSYGTSLGIAADLLSRTDYRILNDTSAYCIIQEDLINWCGVNYSELNSFPYCIASEKWPQEDIGGFLLNTTFTSNRRYHDGLWPIFPSVCVCNIPGRLYYIPIRKIVADQYFTRSCPSEAATLLFFLILIIFSLFTLIYLLWDTGILFYYLIKSNSAERKTKSSRTFLVKVSMIIYFLITIPDQIIYLNPTYSRNSIDSVTTCLRVLGIIFMLFTYALAIFTYLEIILRSGAFGELKSIIKILTIFKWFFISFSSIVVITAIVILSYTSYLFSTLYSYNVPNITVFGEDGKLVGTLVRTFCLLILTFEGILIIVTSILLSYIFFIIRKAKEIVQKKIYRDLFIRFIGLFLGLIIAIPNLAIFTEITVDAGWIETDSIYNPFQTSYLTRRAKTWFAWSLMVTELIWMICIMHSMRTKLSKSWVLNRFNTLLGLFTNNSSSNTKETTVTETNNTINTNYDL